MDNQQEWEQVYSSDTNQHKNKYPSEQVVSWVLRHFGRVDIPHRKQLKCLDIGCGYGNNLKFLMAEGFDAIGIDFSVTVINTLLKQGLNAVAGDAKNMPFENDYFDFIIDRSAIQHNTKEDVIKIYAEVYRLLKPGGRFFSLYKKAGDNGFSTTLLSEPEINTLLSPFSEISIDHYFMTLNNQQDSSANYIISVKK
jgi:SAM-dependent methyltransferase